MCVILQFDSVMPKSSMLKNAEKRNADGGGFAYTRNGLVHWEKGLHVTAKYIEKYIKRNKLTKRNNLIVHFRIGTHGANNDMLCHPFPLGLHKNGIAVENATRGVSDVGVMFHNGIWSEYDEFAVKLAFNSNIRIPDGDMSDSSVMAWIASHKGINFLEFTGEKVIVLTPKGTQRYGSGWTTVDKVKCSNDLFEEKETYWSYGDTYHGSYQGMRWSTKQQKMVKDETIDKDEAGNAEGALEVSSDISSDDYEAIIHEEKKGVMSQQFYNSDELDYYDQGKIMKYNKSGELL